MSTVSFAPADVVFVRSVARRIVGDVDGLDVAQDALLRAFLKRDQFRGDSQYRTWLYRVTVTAALAHLRTRKRRHAVDQRALEQVIGIAPSPEDQLTSNRARRRVRAGIEALRPALRDVAALRYGDELCEADVARELGISVANVRVRGFRARSILRHTLRGA